MDYLIQQSRILCITDYLLCINWELIVAIIALIIAIITIIISSRFQILTFIHAQLIEIAKTCNSYLQDDFQVHKNEKIMQGRASGIVTAFEDCEKIIKEYISESKLICKRDEPRLKKLFYNHLHSSIKVLLKEHLINKNNGFSFEKADKVLDPIIIDQLDKACTYFGIEIQNTLDYEKKRESRLGIS